MGRQDELCRVSEFADQAKTVRMAAMACQNGGGSFYPRVYSKLAHEEARLQMRQPESTLGATESGVDFDCK